MTSWNFTMATPDRNHATPSPFRSLVSKHRESRELLASRSTSNLADLPVIKSDIKQEVSTKRIISAKNTYSSMQMLTDEENRGLVIKSGNDLGLSITGSRPTSGAARSSSRFSFSSNGELPRPASGRQGATLKSSTTHSKVPYPYKSRQGSCQSQM